MVTSASLTAQDPDVVVWKDLDEKWFVAVTFLQTINGKSQALQSLYSYEPGSNNLTMIADPLTPGVHYPQLVSTLLGGNQQCATPNVDVGRNGTLVYVFEDQGVIYARTRSVTNWASAYPTATQPGIVQASPSNLTVCYPDQETDFYCQHPDVAVWEDNSQGLSPVVHIVYIQKSTYSVNDYFQRPLVMSTEVSQLAIPGWQASCGEVQSATTRDPGYANMSDNIEDDERPVYPRITSIYGDDAVLDRYDWMAVWQSTFYPSSSSPQYLINTAAMMGNILQPSPSLLDVSNHHDISQCPNTEPVVAHYFVPNVSCGGLKGKAVCAWTYGSNGAACFISPYTATLENTEIFARPLDADGQFTCLTNDYWQLNKEYKEAQYAPSVSGGHGTAINSLGKNMFFVWVSDQDDDKIMYKDFAANPNPSYRPVATTPTQVVMVVPNPADQTSSIQLDLAPGEHVEDICVTDALTGTATGHLPVVWHPETAALLEPTTMPISQLLPTTARAGLYMLRVQTSSGVRTVRFSYQPQ